MKEGLWGLVNGTEAEPEAADRRAAYAARKDKALAIIVLAIETKLLYLVGDPVDPQVVWEKLANQFQKKSWANKLELKRKLFSMKLTNSGSVQEHVKAMTEVLDELSIVDVPVKEEDRVVYLLASLPDSYSMLVTALEANVEVPKLEVVTERLLHEERKQKTRSNNLVLVKRKLLLQGMVRDLDATIVKSWGTSKEIAMSLLESSRGWPKIEGEVRIVQLSNMQRTPVAKKEPVYL